MPGTLSEEGKQQTIESAPAVEALGIDVVLVSDLKRCTDTYELLSQHIQSLPPMITTKLLRERGWGSATE
jgi:broad specificity phosphatase PhoE